MVQTAPISPIIAYLKPFAFFTPPDFGRNVCNCQKLDLRTVGWLRQPILSSKARK